MMMIDEQNAAREGAAAVESGRQLDADIKAARDREQNLDNFLDGNPLTGGN
jgi:hypothetical protein